MLISFMVENGALRISDWDSSIESVEVIVSNEEKQKRSVARLQRALQLSVNLVSKIHACCIFYVYFFGQDSCLDDNSVSSARDICIRILIIICIVYGRTLRSAEEAIVCSFCCTCYQGTWLHFSKFNNF